jgi:2-polyprenyl-6-methoxyphenol hydroxylase-like FAD-dependent oxidoreductase
VIAATNVTSIHRQDTLDRLPLRSWGNGRVTLLGDAAHPMTFNLGQGASAALKDAVMLSKHVRVQPDIPSALRAYEAGRIRPTTSFTRGSWYIGVLSSWENPVATWLHHQGLKLTGGLVVKQLESDMDFELAATHP